MLVASHVNHLWFSASLAENFLRFFGNPRVNQLLHIVYLTTLDTVRNGIQQEVTQACPLYDEMILLYILEGPRRRAGVLGICYHEIPEFNSSFSD